MKKFFVAASLFFFVVAALAQANNFYYGITTHVVPGANDLALVSRLTKEAKFNSVRDDAFWHMLEKSKGVFDMPQKLSGFNSLLKDFKSQGGTGLLVLGYANPLYDNGGLPLTDEAIQAYVNYVRSVVRFYKNDVALFQVWNEWNIGLGVTAKVRPPGTALAYLKLLRAVTPVIREEAPSAIIVSSAVARMDDGWINSFIDGGGLSLIDVFSVNPYVWSKHNNKPLDSIVWLDSLQKRLRISSGRDFPVYITEMGWPMHRGGMSQRLSADYAVEFLIEAKRRSWIRGVWWYDLIDDGNNKEYFEDNFGLVSSIGEKKNLFEAISNLSPLMISGELKESSTSADGKIEVLEYQVGSEYWTVALNGRGRVVAIPLIGKLHNNIIQLSPIDGARSIVDRPMLMLGERVSIFKHGEKLTLDLSRAR